MILETYRPEETFELGEKLGGGGESGRDLLLKEIWEWEKPCLPRGLPKDLELKNR